MNGMENSDERLAFHCPSGRKARAFIGLLVNYLIAVRGAVAPESYFVIEDGNSDESD